MKLFLLSLLPVALALNCPYPADIPVKDAASNLYTSAIVYQGPGSEHAFQACNGATLTFLDKQSVSVDSPDSFFDVGSLLIKAGCNFIGFKEPNLSGDSQTHSGPQLFTDFHGFDYNAGRGFRSWYTECRMNYISCQPTDEWNVIEVCDATESLTDVTCTYSRTVGTSYSQSMSESMHIDTTISESLKFELWGLFESTLSISATTGYNWGSASSQTQSESETFLVSAQAPPQTRVLIEQVKGHCAGSADVDTDMFKVTHQSKSGKIIKSKIVHKKTGQTVLLV